MNTHNSFLRVMALLVFLALIPLTTCGKDSPTQPKAPEPTPPPPPTPVATRIEISPSSATFTSLGRTIRLNAKVLDQNNSTMANAVVTWTSSDAGVAAVSAQGLVTAVKNGTAQVSARSGNVVANVIVTVSQQVGRINVEPNRLGRLSIGQTVQLTATVLDENLQTIVGALVTWSSSDEAVATVSGQGLVTAVGNGTAKIAVRSGSAGVIVTATVDTDANTELKRERDALIALYNSTNGPYWKTSTHWLSDSPLGTWYGVKTDSEGRVVSLNLYNNGLRGPIPAELGSLKQLETLFLSHNGLIGLIPSELGDLAALEFLNFQENVLTGPIPPELGKLARLRTLWLSWNRLSGPIPPELGNLTEMTRLLLSHNQLNGPIPTILGNLGKLVDLYLSGNKLTGPIPLELTDLSELVHLFLYDNALTGSIPPELGKLARLKELWLWGNQLSGPIPPELGKLVELQYLLLAGNALSGSVPSELGNLENLVRLTLGDNPLEGNIPRSFLRLNKLESMGCRETRGVCLPATEEFREWTRQAVARGEESEETAFPIDIPYCDEIDRQGLIALYETAGGDHWTQSEGWLEDVTLGRWHGVQTDSLGRVSVLDLSSNGLSGSIPEALGLLASMKELRIGNNALTGQLPPGLTAVPLEEFDYAGTSLCVVDDADFQEWLDGIPHHTGSEIQCPPLTDREILTSLYWNTGGPQWANNAGWLTNAPLSSWYGVETNGLGRVVSLKLRRNGLSGLLPTELGQLAHLRVLDLHFSSLSGSIPPALGDLERLERLDLGFNQLSGDLPAELGQLTQLRELYLYSNRLSGSISPQLGDLERLERLYLRSNQLGGEIPPELSRLSRLLTFELGGNELTGSIPPQLGNLANLARMNLADNQISGSIPTELGNLSNLTSLDLSRNKVIGPIPSELGTLSLLEHMLFEENGLTGSIPSELGELANLASLNLASNQLTGRIPPELGDLANLTSLNLANNQLTGPLPVTLGSLSSLERLDLSANAFSGPVPREFGNLSLLTSLIIANNPDLSGRLPSNIADLNRLEMLMAGGTALCRPADARFEAWFRSIVNRRLLVCEVGAAAYLTQVVQSWDDPVPLLAGKPALLRVFVTGSPDGEPTMPDVRTTFYVNGAERHVVHIPSSTQTVPPKVVEGDLSLSANAEIPAWVIVRGLEMVIEIDPDGTLDPALGVEMRIPEDGRLPVDVREPPPFYLTLVPFLSESDPDYSLIESVEAMAVDPHSHELLKDARTLLPVVEFDVTAREPVITSTLHPFTMLNQLEAMRLMEQGSGYWMGIFEKTSERLAIGGVANGVGSFESISVRRASTIAHELGHNLGLDHAPCGNPQNTDPWFPHADGSIGTWGYDFAESALVPPIVYDVMSYCDARYWISDFFFNKALNYRLSSDDGALLAAAQARTLLVWGGRDEDGVPYLDPAFVVDAVPSIPRTGGEYFIEGINADDEVLFSYSFDMPVNPDAEGSEASFVFTLPVQHGWDSNLESITLSGPEGTVVLDKSTNRPMAILQDPVTQQVRAFLSDLPAGGSDRAVAARATVVDPGLEMIFSRGIPDLR